MASWGDYDNDGDLDVLLCGTSSSAAGGQASTLLYRNDGGGQFTRVSPGMVNLKYSASDRGDYDGDGDLDLAISGHPTLVVGVAMTAIFRNDGNDVFSDIGAPLIAASRSAVDWGDFDNDGDLDLAVTGLRREPGFPQVPIASVYRNDGAGVFTDIEAGLVGMGDGSGAWGDYDGDGDLDIPVEGSFHFTGTGSTIIYENKLISGGATSSEDPPDLPGRRISTLVSGYRPAGRHTVHFDASTYPSGRYVYRLTTPEKSLSRTMHLVK